MIQIKQSSFQEEWHNNILPWSILPLLFCLCDDRLHGQYFGFLVKTVWLVLTTSLSLLQYLPVLGGALSPRNVG